MSSVDDRIVNMQWNTKQFTQGATESQRALQGVDQALANTAKGTGLSSMGSQVEGIAGKFSAMKVAGITALATIASKATTAGLGLVKSLTIDPIAQGFQEYQTNLNSIQTIMANTGKGVNVVNHYLNDLNHYSDLTIYSFSQMADAIGKFTSAGVNVKDATSAIKGMANTAALSGSNVQQLNTAMYQMSQALSTGTIRLMDWNSLANAGMGGSNIREALMATNRTLGDHGKAMDSAIQSAGNFRNSLAAGWLSAETFNKTMKVMAGQTVPKGNKALKLLGMTAEQFKKSGLQAGQTVAYTTDQLQKMGYSKEAAKTLNRLSQASIESATKVKTASQAIDVVKESIGSGFGKIFQDLFGNFNEATKLWTGVTNSITTVVSRVFKSVDQMLVGWRNLGGYQDLWTGFGNIFKTIGNLIDPFVQAFKTLLPSTGKAGSNLAALTSGFATFTGWMEKVSRGASVLTPVLVSIFGVFGKIGSVIGAVIHGLAPLAPLLANISNAISGMAQQGSEIASGLISGLVGGLNPNAIKDAIINFANSIVDWAKSALGIHSPSTVFIEIGGNIIAGLVKGIEYTATTLVPAIAKAVVAIVSGFANVVTGIAHGIAAGAPTIGKVFKSIFDHITGLFAGFDSMDWITLFNAILTGGILLSIKRLLGLFTNLSNLGNGVANVFNSVGNSLQAWQQSLKSRMLLEISLAIGVLTASLVVLSFIDPKKLAVGLGAISAMLGTLSATLFALSKIDSNLSLATMATSMVLVAGAMLELTAVIAILGNMDTKTLAKGIAAMGLSLGIMVTAMLGLSGISGKLVSAGVAIVAISAAMTALAGAVAAFGVQDMAQLAKGLAAMGIALGLVTVSLGVLSGNSKGVLAAATSIVLVSGAMTALAVAVALFGHMNIKTLAKGFAAMAVGLGLFVTALLLLSGNSAGVVAAAGAMVLMATAMNLMVGVILVLGAAPWQDVAKGLGFVAAALAIFLLAAAGAMVVAPGLEVLGTSLLAIGAALFLAGAGMLAFATGWALMAVSGVAGTVVIVAAIHAFLALLPEIAAQMAASIVAFLKVIANSTTEIRAAFDKIFENILGVISDNIPVIGALGVKLVTELLQRVREVIPEFGKTISVFIKTGLDVITKAVPQYVNAGTTIILKILEGLNKTLPKIIKAGADLIINFIKGLSAQGIRIANATGQAILDFLNGLDKAIVKYESDIVKAGAKIARDLIAGLVSGLKDSLGWSKIKAAVESMANAIPGWAKKVLGIDSPSKVMHAIGGFLGAGMASGITSSIHLVVSAAIQMMNAILAEGDKAVLAAQRMASKQEAAAEGAKTRAKLAEKEAKQAERHANQVAKRKGFTKAQKKEANQESVQAKKRADKLTNASDQAQKKADRAAQHVQDVQAFRQADLHGKGDIKNDLAVQLADRANQTLAKANAEAARGRELLKTNQKAGRALLDQAKKDAQQAKDLAKRAEKAHKDANKFYAQEVNDRIKQLEDDAAADEQARKDQAAYDAADAQGKSDILTKRADADDIKAKALKAQAAALLAQAKKLAKKDPAKAMKLLDKAQQAADDAQAAADQAADERQQAQQLLDQDQDTGGSDGPTTGVIQPSRSILEDAASSVDRYTASLQEAMLLAGAQQGVMQFVQNNYSPEALSSSELYRQGKNLVSIAQIKMGATTNS